MKETAMDYVSANVDEILKDIPSISSDEVNYEDFQIYEPFVLFEKEKDDYKLNEEIVVFPVVTKGKIICEIVVAENRHGAVTHNITNNLAAELNENHFLEDEVMCVYTRSDKDSVPEHSFVLLQKNEKRLVFMDLSGR